MEREKKKQVKEVFIFVPFGTTERCLSSWTCVVMLFILDQQRKKRTSEGENHTVSQPLWVLFFFLNSSSLPSGQ